MRVADGWKDFEVLDATCEERLERWGDIVLIRPDPQVVWKTKRQNPLWENAHAKYVRSKSGGGAWQVFKKMPEKWTVSYDVLDYILKFAVKPMGFKHTGVFPEQATNWDFMAKNIAEEKARHPEKEIKILNLFGYTGAATLACSAAGASVTHVDAAKGMVLLGKENAVASGLEKNPIRWLVDDCFKFIAREQRRGSKYHGIVMDPPSYGRGPGGEIWKLEENIDELVRNCLPVLSDDALFFIINTYSTGLSPWVMAYLLGDVISSRHKGQVFGDEIGLPVRGTGMVLPCGGTAIWQSELV